MCVHYRGVCITGVCITGVFIRGVFKLQQMFNVRHLHGQKIFCFYARDVLNRAKCVCEIRVGQNRICTPYMTVCTVVSLPKIKCLHRNYVCM
jgi:hypothetical protein